MAPAEKIIPAGLVKVAAVAREAVVYLSSREEPLTVTIPGKESKTTETKPGQPGDAKAGEKRRVGTGIMPDFAFNGQGMKAGAVMPGSAAEKAGLQKGDIIIKIAGSPVENLKQYAELLKAYQPGDTVVFTYLRDGVERTASVTLTER